MQMEFTGERYVPELLSAKISYEHWHRYIFASRFCSHKNILDIACGEGFGSNFLSKNALTVTGVDISAEAIEHAIRKYNNETTKFIESGATSIPFDDESFDVVVSFETLEHLNRADQDLFLNEVVRVLKKEGIFIVSTPNKKIYSDNANYSNPFHLSEFYKEEFEVFLAQHFKNIDIFSQQITGTSLISRKNENLYSIEHIHQTPSGFVPGPISNLVEMEYMIGLCSQVDLVSVTGSILLDDTNSLPI